MARKFNGTSDRIVVDGVRSRPIWWSDPMGRAYAGWVKAPAGQSNVYFFSEGNTGSNTNFWGLNIIQASPATNLLRYSGTSTTAMSGGVVADNTWHHVAFVLDNTGSPPTTGNNAFLYLDGALQASANFGSTITGGTLPDESTFGCLRRVSPSNFLNGLLAHWGIWNRPLSAEEIRMLARGTLPSRFDPQHYFPFTGPDIEAAKDLGRRSNNGTLVGTTMSADVPPLVGQPRPVKLPERYGLALVQPAAVTITLTDSASLVLAADPPTVPISVPTAQITLAADDANTYPVTVEEGQVFISADEPSMFGAIQATSGQLVIQGDAPKMAGPIVASTSGVLKLAADTANTFGPFQPTTGRLVVTDDSPTIIPYQPGPGVATLKGDPPSIGPIAAASGSLRLASAGATVSPIQAANSGALIIRADPPTVATASIILEQSGILRLRADAPTVTPLTEPPPPPPPPPPGTGVSVAVTV